MKLFSASRVARVARSAAGASRSYSFQPCSQAICATASIKKAPKLTTLLGGPLPNARISSRSFHTTPQSRKGVADNDLAQALGKELKYEQTQDANADFISKFKETKTFQILDEEGSNEVVLARDFGQDERIEVKFALDDLEEAEPEEEATEESEEDDEAVETPLAVEVRLSKRNPAAGATVLSGVVDGGSFHFENVTHYPDRNLAFDESATADYNRRGRYAGPILLSLDPALQEAFWAYLDERGINSTLAEFIPEYAIYKEQREYTNWLSSMKKFISTS